MQLNGMLYPHLQEIEQQANEMMDLLIRDMASAQGVTERLKAADQMKWVGLMNNIRNAAEEIVKAELIFR